MSGPRDKVKMAEATLTSQCPHLLLGSIIAELAPATPGVIYRSQDVLDGIGSKELAAGFTFASWDFMTAEGQGGVQGRAAFTISDESVSVHILCPTSILAAEITARSPDVSDAVDVLKRLGPEDLRPVLSRLIDFAGGIMVLGRDDMDPTYKGRGLEFLAATVQQGIQPACAFRFASVIFIAGEPDRIMVSQMVGVREGGPEPEEGRSPFRFDMNFELNPDYVALQKQKEPGYGQP